MSDVLLGDGCAGSDVSVFVRGEKKAVTEVFSITAF